MYPYDEEEEVGFVPGFAVGGVVKETGIALVHEGEWIVPAPGSAAQIEPAALGAMTQVEYHFPVEVEVRGGLSEEDHVAIERRIFGALSQAMERLG